MAGVTATTAEELSVGAGELFFKTPTSLDWTAVGATIDNNVWRHTLTIFAPTLNGVPGPIKGADYIQEEGAELEFSPVQLSPVILALLIPGATSTTETAADVGGGGTGDLDAAIAVGQTSAIKLSSVTGLAVGNWIKIGPALSREIRKLTRVGTALVGGTGVDVDFPFLLAHADGEAFVEVDGAGGTIIVPATARRIPSSAYHDYRLDVPGLDGRMKRYFLYDALMTDNAEAESADDAVAAPRFTLAARIDPANPNRGGWAIRSEPVIS